MEGIHGEKGTVFPSGQYSRWKEYTVKAGRRLRLGYTTGSCAAAAAKAAAAMLLSGRPFPQVRLKTPGGMELLLEVEDIRFNRKTSLESVSCAVRKDSGDDPDITNGALICAEVSFSSVPGIKIEGGEGVGRVTKPGLDQPVGEAAINTTPRRMIEEAVREAEREWKCLQSAAEESGACRGYVVTVSVPRGRELAEKTFNPKLGIVGGISILGTTGIVEPMSDEALRETIRTEIRFRRCEGLKVLPAAPGSYGKAFFLKKYGFSLDTAVATSNFIRDTVEMAVAEGFSKMLFVGHIGKLVKVAGGIPNTHSKYGDHRMEILTEIARECVTDGPDSADRIRDFVSDGPDSADWIRERVTDGPDSTDRTRERVTDGLDSTDRIRKCVSDGSDSSARFFEEDEKAGRKVSSEDPLTDSHRFEELEKALAGCVSADEAIRILRACSLDGQVLRKMTCRIRKVMEGWSCGRMQVEVIVFSNVHGELGKTEGADRFLQEIVRDREREKMLPVTRQSVCER